VCDWADHAGGVWGLAALASIAELAVLKAACGEALSAAALVSEMPAWSDLALYMARIAGARMVVRIDAALAHARVPVPAGVPFAPLVAALLFMQGVGLPEGLDGLSETDMIVRLRMPPLAAVVLVRARGP
jgi:hypothetical protein